MAQRRHFEDGLQSASNYEIHEFVDLPGYEGLGELGLGDVVSIKKLRPDTQYNVQDLIDYIYYPLEANYLGVNEDSEYIKAHPSRDEFVSKVQFWKNSPIQAAYSGEIRRVGDPRYHHPVDFDLDNSGFTLYASEFTPGGALSYTSAEKNVMLDFFNPTFWQGQGTKTKEETEPKYHKVFDILDTDNDGVITREDFRRFAVLQGRGAPDTDKQILVNWNENAVAIGDHYSGYNQHYEAPAITATIAPSGYDPTTSQFSDQFFYSVYAGSNLEQCNNLRMPLYPATESGTAYGAAGARGCTELFGRPGENQGLEGDIDGPIMSLVQLSKEKWVEVLYATDGMACGDDQGNVLCFPFSGDEKLAAAEEYLELVRPNLTIGSDPTINWATGEVIEWPDLSEGEVITWKLQEGATLGGEVPYVVQNEDGSYYTIPANDEVYRAKIKSNTQCPASHPNFHRFCLTRRTLPSLIGPPDQIAPVYGVDETTETT